jgi:hypothetical protein
MSVILARDGDCLKLPEKAWLKILCEVMAEGWERKDAHKLTYEDFKLLLPDPQYEAERRQRGGYRIGTEDALAFAETVLRISEKLRPGDILADALLQGPPRLDFTEARFFLKQLVTFCRSGEFTITMD